MRRINWLVGVAALSAAGVSVSAVSCFKYDTTNCDDYPAQGCPGVGTSSGTGGSTSSSSGNTGGTGGTGGSTPASCIPSENTMPVDDSCGLFVSSTLGDDANAGTKSAPLKSIDAAVKAASGKPVYVCGEAFSEAVAITAGGTIYGALNCTADWGYSATARTELTADADQIPLTISGSGTSTSIHDVNISAKSATAVGGSSIATLVTQASATFTRCDLTAGDGQQGAAGAPFSGSATPGTIGEAGKDACLADQSFGGKTVSNVCGSQTSISGAGGIGDVSAGGNGGNGQPTTTQNFGTGEAGGTCGSGGKGDDGGAGNPGSGATALGSLSASGYAGAIGEDGKPGAPGQGGGGGGGAKGGTTGGKCQTAGMTGGASGGSGGSGGCGGSGGKGGLGGGSSFAIASVNGTLTLNTVMLKTGNGGLGGNGGTGQNGGDGGDPGAGGKAKPTYTNLNDACPGGKGGAGGDGGKGGGGRGGHSVAIAYTGKAPPASSDTTWKAILGTAGNGGAGDTSNGNAGDGAAGVAVEMQQF